MAAAPPAAASTRWCLLAFAASVASAALPASVPLAHSVAVGAIVDTLTRPAAPSAEKVLKKHLRRAQRNGALEEDDRKLVAQQVLGVVVKRRRLEYLLDQALESFRPCQPVLDSEAHAELLLTLLSLEAGAEPRLAAVPLTRHALGGESASALVRALQHAVSHPSWPDGALDALAVRHSLPTWLCELWCDALSAPPTALAVDALAAAASARGPLVLRTNTLRTSRDALLRALGEEGVRAVPTPYSTLGLLLPDGRPRACGEAASAHGAAARGGGVFNLEAWKAGLCELQDEGSQLIALASGARPGATVVDYCAGNGGKTLALAAMMRGTGQLWVHDTRLDRLAQISGRARRAGVPPGLVRVLPRQERTRDQPSPPGSADVVLVDAPCSSTGVLRRHPSLRWELTADECTRKLPALQRQILREACALVRPGGGVLLYATCAINAHEGEQVADWAEAELLAGELEPWPFDGEGGDHAAGGDDTEGALAAAVRASGGGDAGMALPPPGSMSKPGRLQLLPTVHGTDGFFIARWHRR